MIRAFLLSTVSFAVVTEGFVIPNGRIRMSTTLGSTRTQTDVSFDSNHYLSAAARLRATEGNKWEKVKLQKPGDALFREVHEFAAAVRSGKYTWEELDMDDIEIRLKWVGLFHRKKRNPGTFMVRMKIPNGLVTSEQMRFFAKSIEKYDPDIGVMDLTTRQNVQLRGVTIEDASDLITGTQALGCGTFMSGADNVRNVVGSPIAGIDPLELIDTRQLCIDVNNMITNNNKGNPEFANLPRKFNIAISGSRDDFAHTHINDLGFIPVIDPETNTVGFNVIVGGFISMKRAAMSIPLDLWVRPDQVVPLCRGMLEVYRDEGSRKDRQKNRLMYLVEEMGVEAFRSAVVAKAMSATQSPVSNDYSRRRIPEPTDHWERRSILGIHKQKQDGLCWIGIRAGLLGRLTPADVNLIADFAEKYSGGEMRLTVEEGVVFPNVKTELIAESRGHPLFDKFPLEVGKLSASGVACTGAKYCGLALMVTKEKMMEVNKILENRLNIPNTVRIHTTGCPNSCAQAQVGDIGIMGSVAKLNGKAVEGCDIFVGGSIGEHPALGEKIMSKIPADNDHLVPALEEILMSRFGCTLKE